MFKSSSQAEANGVTKKPKKKGFFSRLRERLNRGEAVLTADLGELFSSGKIDDELLEELETRLLMADVGVDATQKIMDALHARISSDELDSVEALVEALKAAIMEILAPCNKPLRLRGAKGPFVLLMVGVNGAGKTTTIGKLARRFKENGISVMLAAGDTFRAAAVEQLQTWGERNRVPVIAQATGADPAAVVYDAFEAAKSRNVDVLIADTAGRLHTQDGLMDELRKIKRVLQRIDADAPHEIMLIIDASNGQNALTQASQFNDAVELTGITITKLDGTAKGGILIAVAEKLGIPIRYVGIGESAEDLGPFEAEQYTEALLKGADTGNS
ncbi:MAG: signal recognition particle-docking protein FtsY [Gammaproteobacteria bacterium]|nr:signal recognition particle-docking protein FtsY [Gammaproteobacteria bacterium]